MRATTDGHSNSAHYFTSVNSVLGLLENSPSNIMYCDRDLVIQYMNPASTRTLESIQAHLPIPVKQIIGSKIDVFHKNPSHQQKILASDKNLPLKTVIRVGPEQLELLVSAIYDDEKAYVGAMVNWEMVTQKLVVNEENARIKSMMDNAPFNIMCADLDGNVTYLNPKSLETLRGLQSYLKIQVNKILGSSFDVFHKNPAHQKNIIMNEHNLPLRSVIEVGPEKLDLYVSAMRDLSGKYTGPMVTWELVTEKLRTQDEMARVMSMMENSPTNVMCCDLDGKITYLNPKSTATLRELQKHLPIGVDQIKGASFDVFHKNANHQRRIISQETNLPHRAMISVGPEKLDLYVSAMRDSKGQYIGPMVVWDVVTKKVSLLETLTSVLGKSAQGLSDTAEAMSVSTSKTTDDSKSATREAENVADGVRTMAASTEEMVASIKEIARSSSEAARMSKEALKQTNDANATVLELGEASTEIGNVIKVISSIAQQTNLLALNATIEAARAGEAGKGFSVVANEVKELAKQTAKATEDIGNRIRAIQDSTAKAVSAIDQIQHVVNEISGVAGSIASAVDEQTAVTNEVARVVQASDRSVSSVVETFRGITVMAEENFNGAQGVLQSSKEMLTLVDNVKELAKEI